MSVINLIRFWNKLPADLQQLVVDLLKGAISGDLRVRRAHEEEIRRAAFEARQKVKLG